MYDQELVSELLNQILEAARRIRRRFGPVRTPDDFLSSDEGVDRLDAIAMMLIVLGELTKNLDKATSGTLLARYPEVDWKGAKGVRDVLSHHYMDLNSDVIFDICRTFVPPLITTVERMRRELAADPTV